LRWAREELAARPLELPRTWPLLVNNRASWPQFLLPAPSGPRTTLGDSLEAMQRTTAREVRASLHRVFGDSLPDSAAELASHPAAGLRMIAAELRQAHERLIAPHWPRIRAVLEADIAYRSTRLTAGGAEHLFADLHPDLRWHHGRLSLDHDHRNRRIKLGPGGLVLLPVALGPTYVLIKGATSTQTTLRYPARGTGTLWTAGTRPVPGSAVRLLGRQRAQLLEALRSPATTTDLAAALQVTASAVSQHLAILRESGLVAGERVGRNVFHRTTERGLDLLNPNLAPPSWSTTPGTCPGTGTDVPIAHGGLSDRTIWLAQLTGMWVWSRMELRCEWCGCQHGGVTTMDSCHPRTATGDDGPQLLRLWAMLFDQDDSPVHQPWRMHAREWFDRLVDDAGSARFPVIEVDGEIVATAIGTLEIGVPNPHCPRGRTVRLANVITLPQYRGRGYGTRLVLHLINWARAIEADRVDLSATPEGQRLYEKVGFTMTSAPRMKLVL